MSRVEPAREAVDEAAADGRNPVQDGKVLPAEDDHPRPGDGVPGSLPGAVLESSQRPAHGPRALGLGQVPGDHGGLGPPGGDLGEPARPEGAPGEQHADGLEEVRLALGVPAGEEVQPAGWTKGESLIVAKITKAEASDLHALNLPFLDENSPSKSSENAP